MENNRKLSASCIVINDDKVLLVKHTYGAAKGKYLIPGGFSKDSEMPQQTAQREVFEETGVSVRAEDLIAVRFTLQEVWCVFSSEYLSGQPISDCMENDEAVFMPIEDALISIDVVETTKQLIKAYLDKNKFVLSKSSFVNKKFDCNSWQLFIQVNRYLRRVQMNEIKFIKPTMEYADEIMSFRQDLLDFGSEFSGCGSLYDCATANEG